MTTSEDAMRLDLEAIKRRHEAGIENCDDIPALIAEIERRDREKGAVVGESWRPIESAPKDGTFVIAWWRLDTDYVPHVVHFVEHPQNAGQVAGWFDDYGASFSDPTHWMPLPEPPESALPNSLHTASKGEGGDR